ncbi:winged helix-turn-helix domain-containing protein [Agrobacterium sp. AGB01]|uniref:winged helix-turn-helix domain-containing protein n=1 Tax=Agrobacterium sp. AGB01 TaxID=2769302 RepID=UPI00177FEC15|nr:winged helix-turn-helix domain-containing protein [Agrobacterium sp. AGB01]MBD9389343.1 winged helix-turn-helix domain-containing protein [Agrobacterium sp. AGB01]
MENCDDVLRLVLRIDFPPDNRLGHGKIRLLELIASTGSISAAGRAMDMSYRRAWLLVDALNSMFSRPVVESQRGGKQGGGAALTEFGNELLHTYRHMQEKLEKAVKPELDWLEKNRSQSSDAGQ